MKIEYTKIFGNNFNSLGEFEMELTPGRHLVVGENLDSKSGNSNGSGKSSLMESIIWTQFKKSMRGTDPSRDGKGNCFTGFECKIGNDEYRIERYHKHLKHGTCSRIILNGEEISHRLSSSTDEEILKLIPIPYDLFVSTSVVLQGIPVNFTQFTPSVRKTIIEDALGFHVWEKIREKFKKQIAKVETDKDALDSRFQKCESLMVDLNARIESTIESSGNQKAEAMEKSKAAKSEVLKLKKKYDELAAAHVDALNGKPRMEIQGLANELRSTLTTFNNRMSDLKTIVEDKLCPTCGTAYPESKLKEATAELKSIVTKTPKLQTNMKEYESTLQKADKIHGDIRAAESALGMKKRELVALNTEIAAQIEPENDKTQELRIKLESTLAEVNGLNEEIGEYAKKLEGLEYIDSLLLPASQFRTKVLEKYLVHVSQIIDIVSPLVFPDVEISLTTNSKATGIDILITKAGRVIEYKTLSGGEKRRLDIVIILAFQRFLIEASGVNTNLVVLDEVFDSLDTRGVESVINCIDTLFPESHAVYVISHNTELKSKFDSIVKVSKSSGVSRLV